MARSSAKPPGETPDTAVPDPSQFGEYSSPPCFMHEFASSFVGLPDGGDQSSHTPPPNLPLDWPAVRQWRKETRAGLIERRVHISAQDRADWSGSIGEKLEAALASAQGKLIGFYWPFRGEYDARPVLAALRRHGTRLALPVVVEKGQPLQFREWWPGIAMTRGVWNIPIPAEGGAVRPDVLIAPLVGFDPSGYRLGYGGGFYDRTIASMSGKPLVIGVGFELARLETIYPQAHDIPMDILITEAEGRAAAVHSGSRGAGMLP